jgi:ankyrin repeat protein
MENFEVVNALIADDPADFQAYFISYFNKDQNEESQNEVSRIFSFFDQIFKDNPSILHAAAFYGANNILKKLIDIGLRPTSIDKKHRTISHFAAAGGNLSFFQSEICIDIFSDDKNSWNIMHYAAEYNQPKILEWGINNKVPADRKSFVGTPLKIACVKNYIRCIEVLCMSKEIQESLKSPNTSSHILLTCLNNRLYEAIPILMEAGLDPEKQWFDNWPLLFFGAASNSDSIPKELIRRGVSVDIRDALGWRALHVAASRRRKQNIELLLEKNADPFIKTSVGTTSFQLANTYHADDKEMECAQMIKRAIISQLAKRIVSLMLERL